MIATNSTPLIYLAKLSYLHLLRDLFDEVIAPADVTREVLSGKTYGYQDAGMAEKGKQDGWLREVELSEAQEAEVLQLRRTFSDISKAGGAAIVVAKGAGVPVCLDDSRAAKVAELMGVGHLGTLAIILLATQRGLMQKKDARRLVLALPERGFFVTHDLLAAFLEKLEQI